jgi:hypothetical protein
LATSVFSLVTLLLQHSKVVHANFLGEEEGKSMKLVLEKVPLSLSLLHLYPF